MTAHRRPYATAGSALTLLALLVGWPGIAAADNAAAEAAQASPSFARLAVSAAATRPPAPGMASARRLPAPRGAGPDVRRVRYRYGPIDVTPGQNWINLGAITAAQARGFHHPDQAGPGARGRDRATVKRGDVPPRQCDKRPRSGPPTSVR